MKRTRHTRRGVPKIVALLSLLLGGLLVWRLSGHDHDTRGGSDVTLAKGKAEGPGLLASEEPVIDRIALVTFITDEHSYLHLALKNKDHYARRHGIDLVVDYEVHTERGTMWHKFEMIERMIRTDRYAWIWWMDFDTLITNTDVVLKDVIRDALAASTTTTTGEHAIDPEGIDFLLTHDCNGLNAGSFLSRGHARTIEFFDAVRAIHQEKHTYENQWSEQDCVVYLLKHDPEFARRALKVPQTRLNAFPEEIKCFEHGSRPWQLGDFVVHFAGAWAHVRGEDPTGQMMRKYGPQIKWGDWRDFYEDVK